MPVVLRGVLLAITVAGACAFTARAIAQDDATIAVEDGRDARMYYPQPVYKPDALAIIHQKAQAKAAQRQARLASLSWYGMSNARPSASPTPFASRYSPVWEMPGNRPFAWHPRSWPGQVVVR